MSDLGLPGKCLHGSIKNQPRVALQLWVICDMFIKTLSWKSKIENIVKRHIYLDRGVPGAAYVLAPRLFSRITKHMMFNHPGLTTSLHIVIKYYTILELTTHECNTERHIISHVKYDDDTEKQ